MSLTNRKKQFLEKLMELYENSDLPVHYETLAKAIGVSKWTAYDMLKQLEKMSLLKKEYVVNNSDTGRSQIVYSPSEKAYNIFNSSSDENITVAEWEHVKQELIEMLVSLKKQKNPNVVSQRLLDNISKVNNKLILCANVITLLITYLKLSNDSKIPNIIHLFNLVHENNTKLAVFTGTVVGMFLTETNIIGIEVMSLASEHINIFGRLSIEEQTKITSFLMDALAL
ncbi:Lrp/AsnC family transcriptional regulator [Priestia flexa]|uniref:Lrp/AsnC family transcriptional regulator n=2 Tax=Bacteria TaxID=2 RepID=UPI001EF5969C|nr:Lrp/AsnC family transcriptional regulator [Priestia flexa]MCG7314799.1 Lrp/AsnC family transcriptional regulator [Priestia flexa]